MWECLGCGAPGGIRQPIRITCRGCQTAIRRDLALPNATNLDILDWLYRRYWHRVGLA